MHVSLVMLVATRDSLAASPSISVCQPQISGDPSVMVLVVVVEVEVVDVVVVAEVVVNQEPLRDKKVLFAVQKTLAMASYCHLDP